MATQVREVTGRPEPFEEVVRMGGLEKPSLMEFNEWQKWRKRSRPNARIDGTATTSRQEVDLWNRVMAEYYGDDWRDQLALQSAEAEEEEEAEEDEYEEESHIADVEQYSEAEEYSEADSAEETNGEGEEE